MKKWILGKYHRLSAEEYGTEESNSISNQKKVIDYYLADKKDITIYKSYVDDGYTGTDFNRPAFKEMLKDIERGKINGVIIKDLSRLGRNYIEVDNFIEETVPYYNLRFISVNDNVDSYKNPNLMASLEIPFKSLINEGYAKDISKKMRSSLVATKKSGDFVGKYAPFGYLKDEEDCHRLIIDEDAAKVVKKIFNLALKGKSKQEIISELEMKNILTPSVYMLERHNVKVSKIGKKWNTKMIDSILKNKMYIGSLVQGKRTRISHKVHNIVRVAEEDWIISNDTHKPIIKEKIFNQVQDILYDRNVKVNKKGKFNKYSGFLKCSECGCNLYRITRPKQGNKIVYYYCSTYINSKKCNKHYILEKEVDEMVLKILNKYIELVCDIKEIIKKNISFSQIEYDSELKKIRMVEIDKELKKYQSLIQEVLNDYKLDVISQNDYEEFKQNYLYEINKLNIEKEELNDEKKEFTNLDWINKVASYGRIFEINKNIVNEFIDRIIVGNDKSINIIFRYKEQYNEIIKFLKSQNYML